jgi:hypothetical protein
MKKTLLTLILLTLSFGSLTAQEKPILTQWSASVNKELPLNEYPRPQMKRSNWKNLNGQWDYSIKSLEAKKPTAWDGKITVPFPIESYLSGVQKRVGATNSLWYKRFFTVDKKDSERVILHFGAVDYESEIYLNGKKISYHKGGYTSFDIDITPYLTGSNEELVVKVIDPTDDGTQARGKQVKNPKGIYYTPVTGIWQTVWYEVVSSTYIKSYKVIADITNETIKITPELYNAQANDQLQVEIVLEGKSIHTKKVDMTTDMTVNIPNPQLWSPDSPKLYDFVLSIIRNNDKIDSVEGYFGMREIKMAKDNTGKNRIYFNGKALFQYGPLDQGYWPDGIYTAPTDEALQSDIIAMKGMGFNMVRKHVKVEPNRWYYHCDRLGLIVWQDMPSGFGEIVPVKDHDFSTEGDWLDKNYKDVERTFDSEKDFRKEWKDIINQLYNHPSICVWVPFNESWGQFKTNEILDWTKSLDSTRIVDGPSGWIDRNGGEARDYHLYNDRLNESLPLEEHRALVIGEFGGLGYAVKDHLFSKDVWSYQGYKNSKELETEYRKLINRVILLKKQGFSAAVYTQLTDVETEINGLITYDRKVIKVPTKNLNKIHKALYEPIE